MADDSHCGREGGKGKGRRKSVAEELFFKKLCKTLSLALLIATVCSERVSAGVATVRYPKETNAREEMESVWRKVLSFISKQRRYDFRFLLREGPFSVFLSVSFSVGETRVFFSSFSSFRFFFVFLFFFFEGRRSFSLF